MSMFKTAFSAYLVGSRALTCLMCMPHVEVGITNRLTSLPARFGARKFVCSLALQTLVTTISKRVVC